MGGITYPNTRAKTKPEEDPAEEDSAGCPRNMADVEDMCSDMREAILEWFSDISGAIAGAFNACDPWQKLPPAVRLGMKKQSNLRNARRFRKGKLKHEPPRFDYFDPKDNEALHVTIKEIKLPRADQTHEVCYEPLTQSCFVTQMSNSVLVRIPIDSQGFLVNNQDAWMVGQRNAEGTKGIGGMHNLSLSSRHKGHLWISMQYSNELMLVDVRPKHTLAVKHVIQVPTSYTDPVTGETIWVGGPHCLRECKLTGDIWVCLKGALKRSPCGKKAAKAKSACCDEKEAEENMKYLQAQGKETPIPNGWAVWRVAPKDYDPEAGQAKGGTLYPCLESPPMLAIDPETGNVYVPQDGADTMLFIDRDRETAVQLKVPFPKDKGVTLTKIVNGSEMISGYAGGWGAKPRITGPAIAQDPSGAVWMSLLGSYNSLVRIDPRENNKRVLYEFGGPAWTSALRLIHLAFSEASDGDDHNRIYALASDLLDEEAVNAVVLLRMDKEWRTCLGRRIIPLPTQDCACHRICFVDADIAGRPKRSRSIVITELASSKLLQIKVRNLTHLVDLIEEITTNAEGFEVRTYTETDDEVGFAC